MNRIAIIDLGTNTCNLLVADYNLKEYKIIWQGKEVVKLGKSGIHKNLIRSDAIERAVNAIAAHKVRTDKLKVDQIIAIATSAVRDADNKIEFCDSIYKKTGVRLQVISGEKEAELIFKGVLLATENLNEESLILDIGGGSNEFIIANGNEINWQESFPQGMARIIEQFEISEPIAKNQIAKIQDYFELGMKPFWEQLAVKQINQLIGCSGAFDTVVDLIDRTEPGSKFRKKQEISIEDFYLVYNLLIGSTAKERMQMKGMEQLRVEMIVPAVLLIELVVRKLGITKICQTDFALREGVLFEHLG